MVIAVCAIAVPLVIAGVTTAVVATGKARTANIHRQARQELAAMNREAMEAQNAIIQNAMRYMNR